MKLTFEDKILLQFGDERKHLQPHEIDADSTGKEIAISGLVKHGYVTAHENCSSRYGRYVSISITTEGKARQKEILQMLNRKWWQRCFDGCKTAVVWCKPHIGQIIIAVLIALILTLLGLST